MNRVAYPILYRAGTVDSAEVERPKCEVDHSPSLVHDQ
jgi:hypothetical protein